MITIDKMKTLFIVILLILNAFLLIQNYQLKNSLSINQEYLMLHIEAIKNNKLKLPKIDIRNLNYMHVNLDSIINSNEYSLLVIFSPSDCGNCLEQEQILWQDLAELQNVELLGISHHKYLNELKEYVYNENINFDVFQENDGKLIEWLHPLTSPLKILVDRNRNIVFVDNIRLSTSSRRRLLKIITLLNKY